MKPGVQPTVAVVIPVFKHSVFLSEAVESVLAQQASFDIVTIIVDDGCPFEETVTVGTSYAMAEPNVYYIRKPNGGLSSARNFGIDFALKNFASVKGVYLLDADNRITPNALETAVETLGSHPDADWVYPNIDKFGTDWSGNFTPPYSKFLHIVFDNICEAGSLISRRMLDAGCRFDETMRAGMEDWEFWLQGIEQGMKGVNAPHFGFEYRFRGESMLSDTDREREAINAYIQKKHRRLFAPRTLVRLEHEESPRFAHIDTDNETVHFFVDPSQRGQAQTFDELLRRIRAAEMEPDHFGVADYILWLAGPAMAELRRVGLAATVLRAMEVLSEQHHFIAVRLIARAGRLAASSHAISSARPLAGGVQGWMTSLNLYRECIRDPSSEWVSTLAGRAPSPNVVELVVEGPFDSKWAGAFPRDATGVFLKLLDHAKRGGQFAEPAKRWNWRESYFLPTRQRYELLKHRLRSGPLNPVCYSDERLQIGVALPIASFGGVEKVAFAVADELAKQGCDLHLFCLGKPEVMLQAGQTYPFKTTNFLSDPNYALWGGSRRFMGHDLRVESDPEAQAGQVAGLLAGLDVLISAQVAPLNAVIGRLRRQGMKIINHVHVIDETEQLRSAGHPYLALGFEHAFDAILTCSATLEAWLHGMGVPKEKLRVIPNAPGFAMNPREWQAALNRRVVRKPGDPLQALFVGRLDEQKGVDRLALAIELTGIAGLNVRWRVIGSSILTEGGGRGWTERLADLNVLVEPPIFDSAKLAEVYLQSDVLALPSRWEGAPLTIIEAQRLGCVPMATDVGAVAELIDDGIDGVLLPGAGAERIAGAMVDALSGLERDRAKLWRMREAAIARGGAADWARNCEPLLELLRGWFPGRLARISR